MEDLFIWLWFLVQALGVLCIAGFIGDKIVAPRFYGTRWREHENAER